MATIKIDFRCEDEPREARRDCWMACKPVDGDDMERVDIPGGDVTRAVELRRLMSQVSSAASHLWPHQTTKLTRDERVACCCCCWWWWSSSSQPPPPPPSIDINSWSELEQNVVSFTFICDLLSLSLSLNNLADVELFRLVCLFRRTLRRRFERIKFKETQVDQTRKTQRGLII